MLTGPCWDKARHRQWWYNIKARWLEFQMDCISESSVLKSWILWQVNRTDLYSVDLKFSVKKSLKATKEGKIRRENCAVVQIMIDIPVSFPVGLHGLGCQRMYSLLCALSLYRCHLLHTQRHNSWVNYPSSSATQGLLLSLSLTYTHTFRVHHPSQQNPHTDCRHTQTELAPWGFRLRVYQLDGVFWSAVINWCTE